jgi:hypothetical protein
MAFLPINIESNKTNEMSLLKRVQERGPRLQLDLYWVTKSARPIADETVRHVFIRKNYEAVFSIVVAPSRNANAFVEKVDR